MVCRNSGFADVGINFGIARVRGAWRGLSTPKPIKGLLIGDVAGKPEALAQDRQIVWR